MEKKFVPEIKGELRKHALEVPKVISQCSGIRIFGNRIKSVVFSTDAAIIRNINADAVIAVYPFTPQPAITQALMTLSEKPVFAGVGGGITTGHRVVSLAIQAEYQGAMGVVVNAPTQNETLQMLRRAVDIPIVVTVVSENEDIQARLDAGASILNVSGAGKTARIVAAIREKFPTVAILATGGPTEATIAETIQAGANAISYTPPTSAELFKSLMETYRKEKE